MWNGNGNGNGNGNAYDRGDYNSSFALRAVELKTKENTCTGPRVLELFSFSTQHETNPAHKGSNASNCWHFYIYTRD